jgi:hypothetical protein
MTAVRKEAMNVARLTQHHRLRPWLLGALLFHSTLTSLPAKAAQAPLTISSYVEQVKTGNQGIQGLRESVEAAEGRAMESSLLTQPHLISQVTQSLGRAARAGATHLRSTRYHQSSPGSPTEFQIRFDRKGDLFFYTYQLYQHVCTAFLGTGSDPLS